MYHEDELFFEDADAHACQDDRWEDDMGCTACDKEGRMKGRVVHCKHEAYDVYVGRGRGSRFGNSYSHKDVPGTHKVETREKAIQRFREDLWEQMRYVPGRLEEVAALHGKTLGCWCKPLDCHGDVLLAAAEWAVKEVSKRERS